MDEPIKTSQDSERSFIGRHSFLVLIILSILISCGLVGVSMSLYNRSGAAQLDLSRPGYVSVRSQATTTDSSFQTYSASGSMSQEIIDDFQSIFTERATKAKSVDAFGSDPLSPDALWGSTDTTTTE